MDDFGFYEEVLAAWDRGDLRDPRFFFSVRSRRLLGCLRTPGMNTEK